MDFLKILKELTKDKQLTRSDICVMAVIVTYAQYADGQAVELSANDIHEEFETIPIRTIKRCVKHLSELHYIEIIRQPKPQKNIYKVLIPIPAVQPKQIYQKKNTNKLNTDDEYIAQALQAMQKNPFMQ
jgi:hypothetical protein